jgi:RND family efflux transporter MFP subunit
MIGCWRFPVGTNDMKKLVTIICLSVWMSVGYAANTISELDCLIEPFTESQVSSSVPGILREYRVDRGDHVTSGQILAMLNTEVERATVDLAKIKAQAKEDLESKKTRLNFIKRKQQRHQDLYKKKAISYQLVDEVETELLLAEQEYRQAKENQRIARVELERAKAALEQKIIRSPVDGIVVDTFIAPGESVEDKPILKMAQIDPLKVEVIVPVELYGSVIEGTTAIVKPEQPIGGEYQARVTIVDRVIDGASGTFGVRLEIPNKDFALPAGLKCTAQFLKK